ncbi:MAG TPA: GGDEF domain-containing protein [Acidobacteriaceae bacterium]|nr:GGDEF domain-containing protein [Acidobacteriaceae bacterium]
MDWSKIPDILGIAALACAFASIVRQDKTPAHRLWLIGWSAIVLHFIALIFADLHGIAGLIANILSLSSLAAAGFCFMWATVPTETKVRSRRLACVAFATCSLYMALALLENVPGWLLDCSAIAIAVAPLMVAIGYKRYGQHALRWLTVGLHFALGAELMVLRRQFPSDLSLGIDAILFVVFLGCCIYFWYSHTNGTTGSVITILGFMAWALVFVTAPMLDHFVPHFHMEGEAWNLPKYVVAIGMLLLLLENQIERSRYLALHDELTALANRRLFQNQLDQALERARRTDGKVALMQIDLDGFKEVNDTHGHHVGDLLLCHVGTMLMRRARRSDTVARTGGDEFSLVLENFSRREDVELVAEALLQMFAQPVVLAGIELHIGASIGIALFPDDAQNARTLCIEADMRMYAVKQDRKDPTHQQPHIIDERASLAG